MWHLAHSRCTVTPCWEPSGFSSEGLTGRKSLLAFPSRAHPQLWHPPAPDTLPPWLPPSLEPPSGVQLVHLPPEGEHCGCAHALSRICPLKSTSPENERRFIFSVDVHPSLIPGVRDVYSSLPVLLAPQAQRGCGTLLRGKPGFSPRASPSAERRGAPGPPGVGDPRRAASPPASGARGSPGGSHHPARPGAPRAAAAARAPAHAPRSAAALRVLRARPRPCLPPPALRVRSARRKELRPRSPDSSGGCKSPVPARRSWLAELLSVVKKYQIANLGPS